MPQSTELILELKWDDVKRMANDYLDTPEAETEMLEHGWDEELVAFIKSDGSEDPAEHQMLLLELAGASVNNKLADIHLKLCEKHWPGTKDEANISGWIERLVETPEGLRRMAPFSLESYGYEDDGMEYVGIGMTSRYYPTWIDWRDPHGGSGHFRLDAEAWEMIEEARVAIAEVIPEIKDAPCTAAPNFY